MTPETKQAFMQEKRDQFQEELRIEKEEGAFAAFYKSFFAVSKYSCFYSKQ